MGVTVKELFWVDDLHRYTLDTDISMTRWKQTPGSDIPPEQSDLVGRRKWTKVPGRLGIDSLGPIFSSDDKVCRMMSATPTIDYAGPGRKVYQVTVGKKHDMKVDGMIDILIQAGYLRKDAKGNVTLVPPDSAPKEKFEFIWVVPKGIAPAWTDKVPKRINRTSERRKVLQSCLEAYVDQFVLEMDPELSFVPSRG
jgi:hypothetical protein